MFFIIIIIIMNIKINIQKNSGLMIKHKLCGS